MQGSLVCPRCTASNIMVGSTGCPSCGVQFAPTTAQVAPLFQPMHSAVSAVAVAPPVVTYALLRHRFVAGLIDLLIINVPLWLLFGPSASDSFRPEDWVSLTATGAYMILMVSSASQATLGMKVMNLRIVRDVSLDQISVGRAAGWWAASILSAVILFIGYIMIAFTQKHQGLHDMLASTVVVRDVPGGLQPPVTYQRSAIQPEHPSHLV